VAVNQRIVIAAEVDEGVSVRSPAGKMVGSWRGVKARCCSTASLHQRRRGTDQSITINGRLVSKIPHRPRAWVACLSATT